MQADAVEARESLSHAENSAFDRLYRKPLRSCRQSSSLESIGAWIRLHDLNSWEFGLFSDPPHFEDCVMWSCVSCRDLDDQSAKVGSLESAVFM